MALLRRRRRPDPAPAPASAPRQPPRPLWTPQPHPSEATSPEARRRRVRVPAAVHLLRAAHPGQAAATAAALAAAAALTGRAAREVALVLGTVLTGQAVLGWHNDLVDRARDARHATAGKPVAQGRLDPGTVWFAIACGVLLVVPLAIANGVSAGSAYLLSLAVGLLGHVVLRRGPLSWVPWAGAYALYPAFLSHGGWGGRAEGSPPEVAMVVLAAALGVGVHVLRALGGLVADHADGWTYLPVRASLRWGASRVFAAAAVYLGAVLGAMAVVGTQVGLSR